MITIPEGVDGVTPVVDGAFTISRELGDDGVPTQVTYTAVTPIESGTSATVSLDVIFASSAANSSVAFPVLQKCVVGETDWSEVAADGQTEDDLQAPAPVVAVGASRPRPVTITATMTATAAAPAKRQRRRMPRRRPIRSPAGSRWRPRRRARRARRRTDRAASSQLIGPRSGAGAVCGLTTNGSRVRGWRIVASVHVPLWSDH
ncbi:MAG: DUF1775 domain-containing protein [Microbacterium sp.]